MRSRMLGGLAAALMLTAVATMATVSRARASELDAHQEVISVSAPSERLITLAPVVVSQVEDLALVARPHSTADILVCLVIERSTDSLSAVNDSVLRRIKVFVPRAMESSVIPNGQSSARSSWRATAYRFPTLEPSYRGRRSS